MVTSTVSSVIGVKLVEVAVGDVDTVKNSVVTSLDPGATVPGATGDDVGTIEPTELAVP